MLTATWRSGYAAVCKTAHPGSIPGVASNKIKDLEEQPSNRKALVIVSSARSPLVRVSLARYHPLAAPPLPTHGRLRLASAIGGSRPSRPAERVLLRVVRENDVSAMHVNHVVLMSVVARRVSLTTGVPYAVMPHGSALEYVVRHDTRMQAMATEALDGADRILVLSDELAGRVHEVLPNIRDFNRKLTRTNVGVNAGEFRLVGRGERRESIGRLGATIAGMERGKLAGQPEYLAQHLHEVFRRRRCVSSWSLQQIT
jgi:hypothetical protein